MSLKVTSHIRHHQECVTGYIMRHIAQHHQSVMLQVMPHIGHHQKCVTVHITPRTGQHGKFGMKLNEVTLPNCQHLNLYKLPAAHVSGELVEVKTCFLDT